MATVTSTEHAGSVSTYFSDRPFIGLAIPRLQLAAVATAHDYPGQFHTSPQLRIQILWLRTSRDAPHVEKKYVDVIATELVTTPTIDKLRVCNYKTEVVPTSHSASSVDATVA